MLRRSLAYALGLTSLCTAAACSGGADTANGFSTPGAGAGAGSGSSTSGSSGSTSTSGSSGWSSSSSTSGSSSGTAGGSASSSASGSSSGAGGGQAGVLTAGDWDDNVNYTFFQKYRDAYSAAYPGSADFDSTDRITITVVDENGDAIPNAQVTVGDGQSSLLSAPTATDGRLLYFPHVDGGFQSNTLSVLVDPPAGQAGVASVEVPAPSGKDWQITLPSAKRLLPTALDVAFVVDATSSMDDEMSYLKAEALGIVDAVTQSFGQIDTHYALIVYRDVGDEYVTRVFDFGSAAAFKTHLDAQSSAGGGDTPESMQVAVAAMDVLGWRAGNVARMAFLIADAPPHPQDGAALLASANVARQQGIKLYPVAASGVDDACEHYMRTSAELTLGRYLFLTNDSGVGGDHQEPHIPCYQVQHLNKLMTRMIASELAGARVYPDPADIVRTVGDPNGHTCTLADATQVSF